MGDVRFGRVHIVLKAVSICFKQTGKAEEVERASRYKTCKGEHKDWIDRYRRRLRGDSPFTDRLCNGVRDRSAMCWRTITPRSIVSCRWSPLGYFIRERKGVVIGQLGSNL